MRIIVYTVVLNRSRTVSRVSAVTEVSLLCREFLQVVEHILIITYTYLLAWLLISFREYVASTTLRYM